MLKEILERLNNCSTGSGYIFTYKNYKVFRTNHLDDIRSTDERDDNYDCDKFKKILDLLFKKRPIGIIDDKYTLIYKEHNKYQAVVINIKNNNIVFITIMQLNKNSINDYKTKDRRIYIGKI